MTIEFFYRAQSTDVLSKEPHTCQQCKRVSYWWRNEGGWSRCIGCVVEAPCEK